MYKDKNKNNLYHVWYNMVSRCNNTKNYKYKNYGLKNITVSNDFVNFEDFYVWSINNGYKNGLTLDRINTKGNYEIKNCRWTNWETQQNNRSNNRIETYNDITDTVSNLCKYFNKDYELVRKRINAGNMSIKEAFETQKRKYKNDNK